MATMSNADTRLIAQDLQVFFHHDSSRAGFFRQVIKPNVERFNKMSSTPPRFESNKEAQVNYNKYVVDKKNGRIKTDVHSALAIYKCTHKSMPTEKLVAKVYSRSHTSLNFLKILRYLGKNIPCIIQTWDVIAKRDKIYVIQDRAIYGNIEEYIRRNGILCEARTRKVAKQLSQAMNHLFSIGISHRSICPRHILVMSSTLQICLSGFRSAVICYNAQHNEMQLFKCIPFERKNQKVNSIYKAPEIFGSAKKDSFDPVMADIFSVGVTLFYLLTVKYPYDNSKGNPMIENEIQSNVRALGVSENAKSALRCMLIIEPKRRLTLDLFKDHPWLLD